MSNRNYENKQTKNNDDGDTSTTAGDFDWGDL